MTLAGVVKEDLTCSGSSSLKKIKKESERASQGGGEGGPEVHELKKKIKTVDLSFMGIYKSINLTLTKEREMKPKTIKAEFLPGGAKRQEMLDQVPEYLLKPGADQATKHAFCLEHLKLTETEYLEALNKATNGGLVKEALWN